jgi:hypothetical protein
MKLSLVGRSVSQSASQLLIRDIPCFILDPVYILRAYVAFPQSLHVKTEVVLLKQTTTLFFHAPHSQLSYDSTVNIMCTVDKVSLNKQTDNINPCI